MINIKGLNKAEILRGLYNNSQPLGMGFIHFTPEMMTVEEAEELLLHTTYFDYLKGRVMKVSLDNDEVLDEWGYDRDNGEGSVQRIIDGLRNK